MGCYGETAHDWRQPHLGDSFLYCQRCPRRVAFDGMGTIVVENIIRARNEQRSDGPQFEAAFLDAYDAWERRKA